MQRVATDTTPVADVLRSQPVTPEMVRLVVDAVAALIIVVDAYGNCDATVEEAKNAPPWSQIEDEVAAVVVPKLVAVVNGKEKFA